MNEYLYINPRRVSDPVEYHKRCQRRNARKAARRAKAIDRFLRRVLPVIFLVVYTAAVVLTVRAW